MWPVSSKLLAIRALQATRKLHLPTYVATRFFVDSIVGHQDSSWAYVMIPRKYPMRKNGQFLISKKLKKVLGDGHREYRDFHVPSPSTALTESLILAYLAQASSFAKPNYIYSYRWPKNTKDCPYNFEHYINGYKARNDDISRFLSENDSDIVIVSDIERFYPTINQETASQRFSQALAQAEIPNEIKITAEKLIEHLFSFYPDGKGIAIGPEVGHVLGDLSLRKIDIALSDRFPGRYFRYVDDIVVIVKKNQENDVIEILGNLTSYEGLTIHPQKTDYLPGKEWLMYGPHTQHKVKMNSFESLIFRIKVFLLTHPNGEHRLARSLLEEGFSLPISRLRSTSIEPRFLGKFKYLLESRWSVVWQALRANERDLVNMAKEVRNEVRDELDNIISKNIPENLTRRKWFIQRLRYLTNRAIYLFPSADLSPLIQYLNKFPEFSDTVALIKLLIGDSYEDILSMPGPALNTAASLLRQANRMLPTVSLDGQSSQVLIDSVSVLLLFGVIKLESTTFTNVNQTTKEILNFCTNQSQPSETRLSQDFSYINEIRTLQLSRSHEEYLNVIETRFSDIETPVLDALDIGGGYLS